ncbi:MAG: MFS transporter [Candidatus Hodarchaeota archaeon]
MESEGSNYKRYYTLIFSLFYLFEGFHQTIPATQSISLYLTYKGQPFDIAILAQISGILILPWSVKFIVGLINDKWGSERFGRRFPFIIGFGTLCGVTWILQGIFLPPDNRIYMNLLVFGIFSNIGMAYADTAIDGLILDVTPKNKLARVQAYTWTCLLIGGGFGAVVLGLLFLYLDMVPVLFAITGIFIIFSSACVYWITEPPLEENKNVWGDIKKLVLTPKNWKMYLYTYADRIPCTILGMLYMYFVMQGLGIIDINDTLVSLQGGAQKDEMAFGVILLSAASGLGTMIGSILTGRIADRSRKKAVYISFGSFFVIALAANLLHGASILGWVLGIIGHIMLGFSSGGISTTGQTIRGDYAKKEFPMLKSTFYSVLISFSNLGLSTGNFLGSGIFISLASFTFQFNLLFLIVSLICVGIMLLVFLVFKIIDPKDYEFEKFIKTTNKEDSRTKEKIQGEKFSHIG